MRRVDGWSPAGQWKVGNERVGADAGCGDAVEQQQQL